jgi:pimeloyl-ACP methyl ester carboxylesterase
VELTVAGKEVRATTGGRPLDPGSPLLVFLHGAGMDRTLWQLQIRYFANHGWSVLAVDLPGHGGSAGPPPDSIAGYAEWVAELIPVAGFSVASVVGHSMGSFIGLHLAARHPGRVNRLALLGTAATMPVHPDLLAAAEAGDPLAFELITCWSLTRRSQLGGHQTPGLWMTGESLRLLDHAPAGVLGNDLRACNAYGEAVENAARVDHPTLLLLGELDIMTRPAAARPLAAALPDAATVILPGAGHLMMIEQPDPVIDTLADFL